MKSLLLAIAASAALALWTHTSRADTIHPTIEQTPAVVAVTAAR